MNELKYFNLPDSIQLENGETIEDVVLAYHTFGALNETKDNVVWIIHALTANANPMEWWPDMVGSNKAIDTNKYFVVCANVLGSHYGSTCPLSINKSTGLPYYHSFPSLTTKDLALPYEALRLHLGIEKINMIIGASLGGQQAMEWNIAQPDVFKKLILIATNAVHSPWGIAFNESQRLAIEADTTWEEGGDEAGRQGLKAARSIALLSYRTAKGYNISQAETNRQYTQLKASSYQQYQGEKLVKRFNAYSYYLFTNAMDSHDVGRNRPSREAALGTIKANTTIVGITSDILFPIEEQEFLQNYIPNSKLVAIESSFGHDGFLIESDVMSNIVKNVLGE